MARFPVVIHVHLQAVHQAAGVSPVARGESVTEASRRAAITGDRSGGPPLAFRGQAPRAASVECWADSASGGASWAGMRVGG